MTKAIVFGDVHGFFGYWYNMIRIMNLDYDFIIQLGDFGWWAESIQNHKHNLTKLFNSKQIYFVRGNHEEMERKGKPFFSDFPGLLRTHFPDVKFPPIHLDGDCVKIEDVVIAGIGGADSHDKTYRLKKEAKTGRKIWWESEAVSEEMVNKIDYDPDIILSHNCPDFLYLQTSYFKPGDKLLSKLYYKHAPRYWFFGHHHSYSNYIDERSGTEFFGLPESKNGFALLTIDKKDINVEVYVGEDE